MTEPGPDLIWLSTSLVLDLYAIAMGIEPEHAPRYMRDPGALDGAVNRPLSYIANADADVALLAALLAHGIAESQPFIDGNKRAALIAAHEPGARVTNA